MKTRDEYFDFLRGIAIMMVVAIHTVPSVTGYNSIREDAILALRQLMNCAVPLFLAVSGYFMAGKTLDTREDILTFWRRQIPRVFIPMVIWSLGWFGMSLLKSHGFSSLLMNLALLFAGGFSVYYFVTLIIQCYLLLPLLTKCKWGGGAILCILSSITAIVVTSYYINIEGKQFPLILYAGPVYLWIAFFMLGIVMRKYPSGWYFKYGVLLAVAGLVFQILESDYYLDLSGGGIGIKLSSFVFSAGMILTLLSEKVHRGYESSKVKRMIGWVGEVSFGVYLLHTYSIFICFKIIGRDNWLFSWGLSLGITLTVIAVMRRIVQKAVLKKYFGF